ncbi:hypothetical protein M1437_01900, partial [Patescibacteria group bacterium]|nr:hypothetical protein [Patescibacteria group bacterium]
FLPSMNLAKGKKQKIKETIEKHLGKIVEPLLKKSKKEFLQYLEMSDEKCSTTALCVFSWDALILCNDFTFNEKFNIVINKLKSVCERKKPLIKNTTSGPVNLTLALKSALIDNLEALDTEAIPYLKKIIKGKNKNDEFIQWITIALGRLGDKSVINDLLQFSINQKAPYYIREESLYALCDGELTNYLSKEKVIYYAKKWWLKDPYCIKLKGESDLIITNPEWKREIVCPVRGGGITVLWNMKIKVDCDLKKYECKFLE